MCVGKGHYLRRFTPPPLPPARSSEARFRVDEDDSAPPAAGATSRGDPHALHSVEEPGFTRVQIVHDQDGVLFGPDVPQMAQTSAEKALENVHAEQFQFGVDEDDATVEEGGNSFTVSPSSSPLSSSSGKT